MNQAPVNIPTKSWRWGGGVSWEGRGAKDARYPDLRGVWPKLSFEMTEGTTGCDKEAGHREDLVCAIVTLSLVLCSKYE